MAEYINREAFLAHMKRTGRYFDVKYDIENFPAADVAPVVRCKDCKSCRELNREDKNEEAYADGVLWCSNWREGVWPDDFCSYGERKEND